MTSTQRHLLIVDDEEAICWSLTRLACDEGYSVSVASSAEEAMDAAAHRRPDLVVMDVRLPGMDGLTAIGHLKERIGPVPVIVMTAFGDLETAVSALRQQAVEYLTKPFDLDDAAAAIQRALQSNVADPRTAAASHAQPHSILGSSPAMQEVYKRIATVAATDVPVLITGESGTGKELVARAVHRHSKRGERPFVPIHLASLSPTLVESELFGHVRGAFTGADQSRSGLLELANDGTVFFDEAGDIPLSLQVKLLRVLEEREITPVGSTKPLASDFRIVAASNRDLKADAMEGRFRQDLYFRLAAFEIRLPPLRERMDDVPVLAEHFVRGDRVGDIMQSGVPCRLADDALAELCRRTWLGNVRELRSAVEHGAVMARGGIIHREHLPPPLVLGGAKTTADEICARCVNGLKSS